MDELSALSALVTAADGRATPEPVIALAIAVGSPWAGDRQDLRDQPSRIAPSSPDGLLRFLDKVRSQLAAPLPADRGWLGWLQYNGLARPLTDLRQVPSWTQNSALKGGWLALPPRGAVVDLDSVLVTDGRLALLHMLCSQIQTDVPIEAAMTLVEWFVGNRAAEWSRLAASQCPALVFPPLRYRLWFQTFRTIRPAQVLPIVCGSPVAASWTRPAPTATELAEQRATEMRKESIRLNLAAIHKTRATA